MTTITQTDSARTVPFFDGAPMMDGLKAEILDDLSGLIDSGRFINGPDVAEFEASFAAYCETGGLRRRRERPRCAAARAARGRPRAGRRGDRARRTRSSRPSRRSRRRAATPVVVDVTDVGLQPRSRGGRGGRRRRARAFLMPVHLYGQMADMRALGLISPTARAARCSRTPARRTAPTRDGLRAGAAGTPRRSASTPAKNLGAIGDAGALVTDDDSSSPSACARSASTARPRSTGTLSRATPRASTRSRRSSSCHKLPLPRRLERRSARARRVLHGGARGRRRPAAAAGRRRAATRSGTCTSSGRRDPEALASFLAARGIATGRHYPEPPHLSEAFAGLGLRRRVVPGRRAARARSALAPDLPGHHRAAARGRGRGDPDYFGWLTARPTTRRTGSSTTSSFGEGVVVQAVHEPLRLPRSATTRASARSSRSSAGRRSARAARSRATRSSATASTIEDEVFVGHGVMFINDKRPRATTDGGELQTDEDWELLRDDGRARRVDRLGRDRSWAACDRRAARSSAPGRSVVTDVAPGEVVVGNPARALASTVRQSAT